MGVSAYFPGSYLSCYPDNNVKFSINLVNRGLSVTSYFNKIKSLDENFAKSTAILVGNPESDLDEAEREIKVAKGHLESIYKVKCVVRNEAKKRAVIELMNTSENIRLFHFSGHGRYPQNGFNQSLSCTDEELKLLDLLAVKNPFGNRSLAILSACESGEFGQVTSNETVGLSLGFSKLEVTALISTSYPVSAIIAEKLITKFYSFLKLGFDSSKALNRSKLDLIKLLPDDYNLKTFFLHCRLASYWPWY